MIKWYKDLLNATLRDAQRNYLVSALKAFLPTENATVLDIGSGNGEFALQIQETMPNLLISGVDVMDRGTPCIPITIYDGEIIPFADKSFDYAMLINMLHHTGDPKSLLIEAMRVTRKSIIIKDHYANNWFDYATLLAMEYSNPNARALLQRPLKFYNKKQWEQLFNSLHLVCDHSTSDLVSYGRGWDILFGRDMHFIGRYNLPAA